MDRNTEDDDDLIVDMEPYDDAKADSLEVEESNGRGLEAPTLPGDEIEEQPARRQQRHVATYDDAPEDNSGELERRVRDAEANAISIKADADARVVEQQRASAKMALDTLSTKLDNAYAQLDNAEASGNRQGVRDIKAAIRDMEKFQTEISAMQSNLPDPRAVYEAGQREAHKVRNATPAGKTVGAGITARIPIAEKWASANGWMRSNGKANDFVIRQSEAMTRDGWEPAASSFYAELARRTKSAFPHLSVSGPATQQQRQGVRPQVRSPVAPARSSSGGPARPSVNAERYTLTAADQRAMSMSKLDPTNAKHRKAFARARIDSAKAAR